MGWIRFRCGCGRGLKADESLSGRPARCPDCAAVLPIPHRDRARHCPHCGERIDPPPRARRKCPRCREWVAVVGGMLMRPGDAAAYREGRNACARASRLLLPVILVGPPGKRHVIRQPAKFMPAEPPDDLPYGDGPHCVIEIDGDSHTLGAGTGPETFGRMIRSMREGRFSGFTDQSDHAERAARRAAFRAKYGLPPREPGAH